MDGDCIILTLPTMSLTCPDDNVISFLFGVDVPGGTYAPNLSDGYWLILAPLSKGRHTVRVKGATSAALLGR